MPYQNFLAGFTAPLIVVVLAASRIMTATRASAQTETVIYNFANFNGDTTGGTAPSSRLRFDAAGNLFGLASGGGVYGPGTMFELTPASGGGWTERAAYSFKGAPQGKHPSAGLSADSAGNFYGVTLAGGGGTSICGLWGAGCGTVFRLTPQAGGNWSAKYLHSFQGTDDGAYPYGGVIVDAAGNVYGTTLAGGKNPCAPEQGFPGNGCGTVFELSPTEAGGWVEKVLHNFEGAILGAPGLDGQAPMGGLILDASGNLYGTTTTGGAYGKGTVFELSPKSGGGWAEKTLHNFTFNGSDGYSPQASLVFDAAGNLYGTTQFGGAGQCMDYSGTYVVGCGTVFELSPKSSGGWREAVVYSFQVNGTDGWYPMGDLVFDASRNLYGTTNQGGSGFCTDGNGVLLGCGTVFKLSRKPGESWTETLLHDFQNIPSDGQFPTGDVILDASGNLYGTTYSGGNSGSGGGTVFKITP
ncbi:MAG: choice-of-anchor tandem repeat GloVer-containing protein [Candidatus Sulfotelmatobacter sp.]